MCLILRSREESNLLRLKHALIPQLNDFLALGEPKKNGAHKVFTLQNRNTCICKQNIGNRSLSLSIILSLPNQICNKEFFEPPEKVLRH